MRKRVVAMLRRSSNDFSFLFRNKLNFHDFDSSRSIYSSRVWKLSCVFEHINVYTHSSREISKRRKLRGREKKEVSAEINRISLKDPSSASSLEMKGIFRWSEESRNSKLMGILGGNGDSLSPSPQCAGVRWTSRAKIKKKKRFHRLNGVTGGNDNR